MTHDYIQDLIQSCEREGKVFVIAIGDPDSGSVDIFENTEVAGDATNQKGETTPEVLSSSIGEALGLDGNDGADWWKDNGS